MRPMAAGLVGALISGVAMYAVGVRATQYDTLKDAPALVQTMDGRYAYVPAGTLQPAAFNTSAPTVQPVAVSRPVYRTVRSAPATRTVYTEDARPRRSWAKTALIVGGSAGTGAGVGAIVGGKKGALIGAALGGGAASIYEATRR